MKPDKESKFDEMGVGLMELLPDGVRAFLFIALSDGEALKELWRSGERAKGIGGDGRRVLGICSKRQRSVLIYDSEKDTQMRGIKFRSFLSSLCVPVFSQDRSLIGAILVISETPETFTDEHKFAVERSARDYGPILSGFRKFTQNEGLDPEKSEHFGIFTSPFAWGFTALAFMLLGIWLLSPTAPQKPQASVAEQKLAPAPQVSNIAESFLKRLQEGAYDQAWLMLHPELRSGWASTDFNRALSHWAEQGDNKAFLAQRSISRLQRHNRNALATLMESPVSGDQGHWKWQFREVEGEWALYSLDGPIKGPGSK